MLAKILLLSIFVALSFQQGSDVGINKSQELRDKILSSTDDIVTLTAAEYQHFVNESPRPYDVVVYFTAPQCTLCEDIEEELKKVAVLYKQNGAVYPYRDGAKRLRAVYFVKVVFEASTKSIFGQFGFKSVPNLLVSQPKMLRLKDSEKVEYFRSYLWQISHSDGTLTSQKLLEHVNKKTERNVEYKESILNLLIVLAIFGMIAMTGVWLFLKFRPFFLNTKLWFVGSMTVYFICMSGIVYNILHNVPFNNIDKNGNVEWIHSGGRSQFGAEGYIMSASVSALGILFISLLKVPKFVSAGTTRVITYLVLFISIYFVLSKIEEIYKTKSGFYNPIFFPPAHYQRGPLKNDQGNNI